MNSQQDTSKISYKNSRKNSLSNILRDLNSSFQLRLHCLPIRKLSQQKSVNSSIQYHSLKGSKIQPQKKQNRLKISGLSVASRSSRGKATNSSILRRENQIITLQFDDIYNIVQQMDSAYQNFNSGKYKQAYNILHANPSNLDSYEPNMLICEYLANRCQQSAYNCIKKLQDFLQKRNKRDLARADPQTQCIVKLNISILLILQGRRQCAIIVLNQLYRLKNSLIQFLQMRIFLLLMELYSLSKMPIETLDLEMKYLVRPIQGKTPPTQWISVGLHEHPKIYNVIKQQFNFMVMTYQTYAFMQLGLSPLLLVQFEEYESIKNQLLSKIKKRKNITNKYFQTNILMIGRFIEAQRQIYSKDYSKALSLMNFVQMAQQYQLMRSTKIITNIFNAFSFSNTAYIHYHLGKPNIALSYFTKAKTLLMKACTGVEDKDLHLFSLNYGNELDSINYNQALALLALKQKQAYSYFDIIRKTNNITRNYKHWYRIAQSTLIYYHDSSASQNQKKMLLQNVLSSLNNALMCLNKTKIPTVDELQAFPSLKNVHQEQLSAIVMKFKNQIIIYRHSILTLICYVSLLLGLWKRVIKIGKMLLEDTKLDDKNRLNVLFYISQAENMSGKQVKSQLICLQNLQHDSLRLGNTLAIYTNEKNQFLQKLSYETIFYWNLMKRYIQQNKYNEAWKCCEYIKQKQGNKITQSLRNAINLMGIHFKLGSKYKQPYTRPPSS